MTIKVLVVDDSALMRKVISTVLNECTDIEVIDTARNGEEALKIIDRSKPDLVTLDVEMPVMNGIETLQRIKEMTNMPVIMLSSKSNENTTIKALELGAEDFIEKPVSIQENWTAFKEDLEKRIRVHFSKKSEISKQSEYKKLIPDILLNKKETLKAIAIGASTGGPKALVSIIQSLPKDLSLPVFIVQHMPEGFTQSFSNRLNTLAAVKVVEASHGDKIVAGTVYVAPGGKHMVLNQSTIELNEKEKVHSVRPAVDYLFESVSDKYGQDVLGVVLTGMGKDGTVGSQSIKEAGGYILTQDKASSVVYGMPRAVIENGYSDQTNNLVDIADIIKEMTR